MKEKKEEFDEEKNEQLFCLEGPVNQYNSAIEVGVYRYDGGKPKVQLGRIIPGKEPEQVSRKRLGRVTYDESLILCELIKKAQEFIETKLKGDEEGGVCQQ